MPQNETERLVDRVTTLTGEATRLTRFGAGSYRRQQIEWQLVQLYRRIAETSDHPERLRIVSQMWGAVEQHVDDAQTREHIKQAWLRIRS